MAQARKQTDINESPIARRLGDYIYEKLRACLIDKKHVAHFTAHTYSKPIVDNSELSSQIKRWFKDALDATSITARQKIYSSNNHILMLPEIKKLLDNLITSMAAGYHLNADKNLLDTYLQGELAKFIKEEYEEKIKAALTNFAAEKYVKVDSRTQIDDIDIRRMDSLAKLFDFTSMLSVCNAVTIHEGALIVSYNISDVNVKDEILGKLRIRLQEFNSLFKHLPSLASSGSHEQAEMVLSTSANNLYCTGYGLPKEIVHQALSRITDLVLFDDEPFEDDVVKTVLKCANNIKVLFPDVDANKNFRILVASSGFKPKDYRYINVDGINSHAATVTHFHAEQILAFYLRGKKNYKEKYSKDKLLPLGVTKLCCPTCHHNLKDEPVKVRGYHGDFDPKTISLLVSEPMQRAIPKTPKQHITYADRSPQKPLRHRFNSIDEKGVSSARVMRHLDFGTDEQDELMVENIKRTTTTVEEIVNGVTRKTTVVQETINRAYASHNQHTLFFDVNPVTADYSADDEEFRSAEEASDSESSQEQRRCVIL